MTWVYLLIAGLLEIVWATFLKLSVGFSKLGYSVITVLGMIASFYFLSKSLEKLPLGTAYAIWTGIGALGAVIVGVVFFNEEISLQKIVFTLFFLVGLIGLKISSSQ